MYNCFGRQMTSLLWGTFQHNQQLHFSLSFKQSSHQEDPVDKLQANRKIHVKISSNYFTTFLNGIFGPYDFRNPENTDRIAEFDDKNGINCKTRKIVEFAQMWMQFIKIQVFPPLQAFFHSAYAKWTDEKTILRCFGVIYGHTASVLCSLWVW